MVVAILKTQRAEEELDTMIKSTGSCGWEIKIAAEAGGMILAGGNYHDVRYIYG
jgi:hypothetical protein